MQLQGRVAIVTGSSRGIGKAIAVAYAKEGASVVVTARTENQGESHIPGTIRQTVDEINALGAGKAIAIKCDLKNEAQIAAMVRQTIETFGQIDILVNNAGDWTSPGESVLDIPTDYWDHSMSLNVRATFLCCKHVLPNMVERGRGSVINVSSGAAIYNSAALATYCTAKAAQERFSGCVAEDMKRFNIAVNCLRPGATQTEGVWDHGYPLDPEVIKTYPTADVMVAPAIWLAQQTAETFTGQVVSYRDFGVTWGEGAA